jgi:tRNA pseudouridine55 synthase
MVDSDGLLIVDKPEGITSHDVVDRVRRLLRMKRIGHTGTLDPMATGVLVLCLGKATRLQQFFTRSDKEYLARIRLGFATDTYDRTGNPITPLTASNGVMEEQIQRVLEDLQGIREQLPPMFSAKKQAGTRLYKLARQGKEVPRTAIGVKIYALDLLSEAGDVLHRNSDGTSDFSLLVRCSAGAYVRSLAHDIGQALGCGGHLLALRRNAVGAFRIEQAIALEELERLAQREEASKRVIPLAQVPLDLPTIALSPAEAETLRHGQTVKGRQGTDGPYCQLIDQQGNLVAIGEVLVAEGVIQPRIVLY